MQIKVKVSEFLEILNKIKHIAKPEKSCPALTNAIFETTGNGVQVAVSSLTNYAVVSAPAEIIEPGKCLIEIGKLSTILSTLSGEAVIEEKDSVIWIKCGNTKCRLEKKTLSEYPENLFNMKETQFSFRITSSALAEGFKKTEKFTSGLANGILNSVNIKVENNIVKFAATDGHRLANVVKTTETPDVKCDIIIPFDAVSNLLPLILSGGDVEISTNESICKFEINSGFADGRSIASPDSEQMTPAAAKPLRRNSESVEQIQDTERGDIIFCARLIEGQYPNFERLIPKESAISFSLNKEELKNVLERISVVEAKEDQNRVMFSIKGAMAIVEAKDYKCNDVLTLTEKSGDDISFIINRLFLEAVLSVMSTDTVKFNMNSSMSAILFPDMEHHYLVMPMV